VKTADPTREYFDRQAPGWERYYAAGGCMASRIPRFGEALRRRLPPGSRILDFGCGSGDLSDSLARGGYRVVGVDRAANMITRARQRFAPERVTFQWLGDSYSGSSLPFPDGVFDAVICSSVLEYVDNASACLRELARVCRCGGWLVATVPNMMHPVRAVERLERVVRSMLARSERTPGRRMEYLALSKNRFSLRTWLGLLADSGWQEEEIAGRTRDLLLVVARRLNRGCLDD